MKYKFILENLETGEINKHRTITEIAEKLNINYHQARSVLKSDEKQFLHPIIKNICKKYKVSINTEF
jgi:ribosomal protein S25